MEAENNAQRLRLPANLDELTIRPSVLVDSDESGVRLELEVLRHETKTSDEKASPRGAVQFHPRTLPPVRGRWEEFFAEVRRLLEGGTWFTSSGHSLRTWTISSRCSARTKSRVPKAASPCPRAAA
jgi:hypothetical protein